LNLLFGLFELVIVGCEQGRKFDTMASLIECVTVEHRVCDDKLRVLRALTGPRASLPSSSLVIHEVHVDQYAPLCYISRSVCF
jgi:hypothetical protein